MKRQTIQKRACLETLTVRAGQEVDSGTGAVTQPIYLSTIFERAADGSFPHGYIYTRRNNPNRAALETSLAALEGGAAAAAFSSGSAVTMSVLQSLSPGDHVIAPDDAYYGTTKLLRDIFSHWGVRSTFVDMSDPHNVRAAIQRDTKLIWIESPSNPLLKITDIAAVAEIAREAGARSLCDNTFATPVLQRPLELGVDLVMHSMTKFIGGNSDLLGGILITRRNDEFWGRIKTMQIEGGAVPSPFECWLALRSVRTLPCRVRAQSESALRIARFLSRHRRVEAVHYPGLRTHPGHRIAARQMSGFGGVLAFQVKGGRHEAFVVAARAQIFTRATSLGGVESLIEHRASIEGAKSRTPQNLLRVSVGLENVEDLIADLASALK